MTDSPLPPAADLAAAASRPYPNDSAEHRAARTALLAEEVELRRRIEQVAERRRALPPGGEIPEDYALIGEDGREMRFSALFGDHDTLYTYTWMFGPERARPCPMCTAFLDALEPAAGHLMQRIAVAVIGRSPIERQLGFKRERGWRHLPFHQILGDAFPTAYRALGPDGEEWPAIDVWVKRDGRVHHFWAPELAGTQDPGQDPRLAPEPTPLWNILDLTPAGRGTDWYPALDR